MFYRPILRHFPSFALLTLLLLSYASAEMQVDNTILFFEPGKPAREDVTITNTGEEPLYIKVTPTVVENPGKSTQKRVPVTDPKAAGLLVSPVKMAIAPGGRKRVRFVNLNPARDEEGVFRVTLQPVAGEVTANTTAIKVMVGYEVLVLAKPLNPKSELIAKRKGNRLTLENHGNSNVLLFQGQQCQAGKSSDNNCEPLKDHRLYAGNSWQIDLPYREGPVTYYLSDGKQNILRTFP